MMDLQVQRQLWGKPIRYLIGANNVSAVKTHFTITPYLQNVINPSPEFLVGGYCNMLDEEDSGEFPPYLKADDDSTAAEWREGLIDPDGPGFVANLTIQFDKRKGEQQIHYVELDNPDSYKWLKGIKKAYDLAQSHGAYVLVKNPLMCDEPEKMIQHPAACGIIVEADCGLPQELERLRAPIGHMPVWFVTDRAHEPWAKQCADTIFNKHLLGMGVTVSSRSGRNQYNDSRDVLLPIT
jgi:hypothetical protein